jgi:hypothetical protein
VAARGARVWLPHRLEEATEGSGLRGGLYYFRTFNLPFLMFMCWRLTHKYKKYSFNLPLCCEHKNLHGIVYQWFNEFAET